MHVTLCRLSTATSPSDVSALSLHDALPIFCLWAPRHRLLFTGDVLQVRWGRLTYARAFFSHDYPAARAAVSRLATLDVETIALAHYGLWQRDAHERLRALAAAAR